MFQPLLIKPNNKGVLDQSAPCVPWCFCVPGACGPGRSGDLIGMVWLKEKEDADGCGGSSQKETHLPTPVFQVLC